MKILNDILVNLNNREKALFIWIGIFAILVLLKKDVRESIWNAIKGFFQKYIFLIFFFMFIYIFLSVYFLEYLQFWDTSMLKDTIIWTLGTALITLVYVNKFSDDESNFNKLIIDNLKLIILLEFLFNLYSFSLVIELFVVPFIFLLVGLSTVASIYKESQFLSKYLNLILSFFGFAIIIYTFYKIFTDLDNFISVSNLKTFLLPIVLIFLFLPYLYFIALYLSYDKFFSKINFIFKDEKELIKPTKKAILRICKLNLPKLNRTRKIRYDLFYDVIKRNLTS